MIRERRPWPGRRHDLDPEPFQSAADELTAEVFTLQEAERVEEEGFDDVIAYGGGVGVRHSAFLSREAVHVIII